MGRKINRFAINKKRNGTIILTLSFSAIVLCTPTLISRLPLMGRKINHTHTHTHPFRNIWINGLTQQMPHSKWEKKRFLFRSSILAYRHKWAINFWLGYEQISPCPKLNHSTMLNQHIVFYTFEKWNVYFCNPLSFAVLVLSCKLQYDGRF